MTLTIDLSDEQETALREKATTQGISAEQYAQQVLERDLQADKPEHRHISGVIRENMRDVPREVFAEMPSDGASEHDHYIYGLHIYGLPKREY